MNENVKEVLKYSEKCLIKPDSKVSLDDIPTGYEGKTLDKESAQELLQMNRELMAEFQDKLIAHDEHSVLIVLQAMDAAGKDGVIKHIMSGLNPAGVKVMSYKAPSSRELDHDYFWRHYVGLPSRGEIGIFNRSHYENVLVTKVHPEYLLNERLPGINSVDDVTRDFWEMRYKQINRFERNLYENGTVILKFFLHISKDEQKERFLARIDDPKKNWKFSPADAKERQYWDDYKKAYEKALEATSKDYAPWYVIPSDKKWWGRLLISSIVYKEFEKLHFSYPEASKELLAKLEEIRQNLMNE